MIPIKKGSHSQIPDKKWLDECWKKGINPFFQKKTLWFGSISSGMSWTAMPDQTGLTGEATLKPE
jgi:hypothetical protein